MVKKFQRIRIIVAKSLRFAQNGKLNKNIVGCFSSKSNEKQQKYVKKNRWKMARKLFFIPRVEMKIFFLIFAPPPGTEFGSPVAKIPPLGTQNLVKGAPPTRTSRYALAHSKIDSTGFQTHSECTQHYSSHMLWVFYKAERLALKTVFPEISWSAVSQSILQKLRTIETACKHENRAVWSQRAWMPKQHGLRTQLR